MSERAVQFGRTGTLAGVLATPTATAAATAADDALPLLVMPRSALLKGAAPRRLTVELARAARERGLQSLRFDLGGCGDSGERPAGETDDAAAVNDVCDALDFLARPDPQRRFVLLGVNADLDAIVRVAAEDERVAGLVSINGPAFRTGGYWLRRCARALVFSGSGRPDDSEGRAAGRLARDRHAFAAAIQVLADRGVRMLHVYSGGATAREFNHARQFWSMLPPLRTNGRLAVAHLPAADRGFTCREDRGQLFDICLGWMER